MRQTTKSITLVSLFLLSLFSGMVIGTEQAEASTVVITEAVRIVDGGTASDTQATVASDSEGNVHIVWARNTQHLYYSMLSPRGETLIDATQITSPGLHKVWHPDMVVDEMIVSTSCGQTNLDNTRLCTPQSIHISHRLMAWLQKMPQFPSSMIPLFR